MSGDVEDRREQKRYAERRMVQNIRMNYYNLDHNPLLTIPKSIQL